MKVPKPARKYLKNIEHRLKYLAGGVLSFEIRAFGKVILPIPRRVMPSVIAADIIGVQPMSGPAAQIFTLKHRYGHPLMEDGLNMHEHWGRELHNKIDVLKAWWVDYDGR